MKKNIRKVVLLIILMSTGVTFIAQAQNKVPRQYTNPDEIVTFDRSTSFERALDVINDFAQQYKGKIIIDRTSTTGTIGISIPPMHWRDALDIILHSKYLQLIEKPDYYEIVRAQSNLAAEKQGPNLGATPDTALTTNSKEVRINAIFFEGNRRALQEVGVDWSTLTENVPENISSFVNSNGNSGGGGSSSGGSGSGGGGQQGQLPDVSNFDGPFVSVNAKGAQSVSQNVFNSIVNFGDVFGSGISVQALFSAFQADNLGEILASPSVKVLEGEEGHIQVGQDFSIKQADFAGNTTDKFFSVGTILNVTPQIIEYQDTTFIHLNIEAERSSAQPDAVSTVINKQNATTQALLLDNEATVIAGLYRTESTEVRKGIPILKDLPPWFFGLRYLFGYNSKDYQTRELVILIQASIEPSIPERMQQEHLPTELELLRKERNRMDRDIKNFRNMKHKPEQLLKDENDENQVEQDTTKVSGDEHVQSMRLHDEEEPAANLQSAASHKPMVRNQEPQTTNSSEANNIPKTTSKKDHDYTYYVVGGAFKNQSNAEELKSTLKKQGYEPEILVNSENGFYVVSYQGFDQRKPALRLLSKVKENTRVDAWIYNNY